MEPMDPTHQLPPEMGALYRPGRGRAAAGALLGASLVGGGCWMVPSPVKRSACPLTITLALTEELPLAAAPPPPPGGGPSRPMGRPGSAPEPHPTVPDPMPSTVPPEAPLDLPVSAPWNGGGAAGVPGGVPGGVQGGAVGGVVGGKTGGVVGGVAEGVVPPRFDAAYLKNPAPVYPSLSRRLGEAGRVVLRVRVSAAGLPEQLEVKTSSGFPRLDAAAMEAVRRWKFIPARLGEEATGAWVLVPLTFDLEA